MCSSDLKTIGLWGHLDVVPAGDNWEYEPFDMTLVGDLLICRGVQDNKGPTVIAMYVLKCFKELGIELNHRIELFFGTDEENGMRDLEYFTENFEAPSLSIIPDSGFPVCFGEKGVLEANLISEKPLSSDIVDIRGGTVSNMVPDYCEITLRYKDEYEDKLHDLPQSFSYKKEGENLIIISRGIAKHPAFPEGGVSAIHELVKLLLDKNFLNDEDRPIFEFLRKCGEDFEGKGLGIDMADELSGPLSCVGSIIGLDEGRISQHINVRYPVTADSEAIIKRGEENLSEADFIFSLVRDSKPNLFPWENPLVDKLTKLFNDMTGLDKEPYVMGGGTYARKLPNAFAYGMGSLPREEDPLTSLKPGHGGAHEPDEAFYIKDILPAFKIYSMALIMLSDLEI